MANKHAAIETLCSLRLCDACGKEFQPNFPTQRFCCHACYSDSIRLPIAPRFWAKVHKTPTCWNWTGARTGSGPVKHGQVMWREHYRTPQKAHRVAWELTFGPIPVGRQINHHCDNPVCCRPEHLYLGTQDDNMKDASVRGRFHVPHTQKLSLYDRLTIYQTAGYRGLCVDLARQYGVTKAAISTIRRGRFLGSGVWAGTKQRTA